MKTSLETFNASVIRYNLLFNRFQTEDLGWKIWKSKISGKGVVATKSYEPGELIFVDYPLVVGPKNVQTTQEPFCVICYKVLVARKICSGGCKLYVCSVECERNANHEFECQYLRKLNTICEAETPGHLARSLVPVRTLQFSSLEKEIFNNLYRSKGAHHGAEITLLKNVSANQVPSSDEKFMRTCCRVLDGNAYEIQASGPNTANIRGLYPMASILNHSCCPNTTHSFTDKYEMVIRAATRIDPGTEITSAYCPLLLGTIARRHFIQKSKDFGCQCSRCADKTECGTLLSALKCRSARCTEGHLLPNEPLQMNSIWSCDHCGVQLSANKIAVLQNVIGLSISKMDSKSANQIIEFIENDGLVVSKTHHTIVQYKFVLLNLIGYVDPYKWSDLSNEMLNFKKNICLELLDIVSKLSLGQCSVKAICLSELKKTNRELQLKENGKSCS